MGGVLKWRIPKCIARNQAQHRAQQLPGKKLALMLDTCASICCRVLFTCSCSSRTCQGQGEGRDVDQSHGAWEHLERVANRQMKARWASGAPKGVCGMHSSQFKDPTS